METRLQIAYDNNTGYYIYWKQYSKYWLIIESMDTLTLTVVGVFKVKGRYSSIITMLIYIVHSLKHDTFNTALIIVIW